MSSDYPVVSNDDLVMSFAIGQYMRDTAFKYKQHGMDLTKNMLNNISSNKPKYIGAYSPSTNESNEASTVNSLPRLFRNTF